MSVLQEAFAGSPVMAPHSLRQLALIIPRPSHPVPSELAPPIVPLPIRALSDRRVPLLRSQRVSVESLLRPDGGLMSSCRPLGTIWDHQRQGRRSRGTVEDRRGPTSDRLGARLRAFPSSIRLYLYVNSTRDRLDVTDTLRAARWVRFPSRSSPICRRRLSGSSFRPQYCELDRPCTVPGSDQGTNQRLMWNSSVNGPVPSK